MGFGKPEESVGTSTPPCRTKWTNETYSRHTPLAVPPGVEHDPLGTLPRPWPLSKCDVLKIRAVRQHTSRYTHAYAPIQWPPPKKFHVVEHIFSQLYFVWVAGGMTDWTKSSNRIDFNLFAQAKQKRRRQKVNSDLCCFWWINYINNRKAKAKSRVQR